MPRGIFNPEGEFLRKLHEEKRGEDKNEPSEIDEEPTEELPEEEEARNKLHDEAAARYETGLKNPPHTIEENMDAAAEKEQRLLKETRYNKLSAARDKQRAKGIKKERPKGGETIREKRAA